jgi:hypothetical protein
MAEINDLSACDYFPFEGVDLIAVGWLGSNSSYMRGSVSASFLHALKTLCESPWQPVGASGMHQCELCQFDGPNFGDNVFVPHAGRIYVAPVGVIHYIAAHWYQPPPVFIDAVLACPPMRGQDYLKALLANGGRNLIKAGRG